MKTRLRPGRWEVIATITACLLVWAVASALRVTDRVEAALPNPFDHALAALATAAALIGLRRWRQASLATRHLSDIHEELARQADAERVGVSEYAPAQAALAKLRPRRFRLAVDDAGAGHSSLRHILELSPEIIKLDRELIHDIHVDVARSTLGKALAEFANSIGSVIVAEGIEVEGELNTAVDIGVQYGQGYLLARPSPAAEVVEAF